MFCLKKIMAFVLSVVLIAGIIVPTFLVTLNISAEEAYTGVIDNGGSEEMAYPFVDGGNTATNTQDSSQVHSGDYSTKVVARNSGMNASFRIESTTNYNKIPLNKEVYIHSGQKQTIPKVLRVLYLREMFIRPVKTALPTN